MEIFWEIVVRQNQYEIFKKHTDRSYMSVFHNDSLRNLNNEILNYVYISNSGVLKLIVLKLINNLIFLIGIFKWKLILNSNQ